MKLARFNGKNYEVTGGGGGETAHTHPNLSLLNSITQAMVTAWQAAGTWVTTNGAAVLSHLSDTVAHITAAERTAWNAKYSKPTSGIPKTDLASAVQTSLGKADSALQSYTETDPVFSRSAARGITQTDIQDWGEAASWVSSYGSGTNAHMADTTKHITAAERTTWNGKQNAISDLSTIREGAALGATALQEHQDISGKMDKPSGGNAGDILTKTASGAKWSAPVEEYALIERIELTEDVTSLFRNAEPDNTPYNFKRIVVTVEIPATASKTNYTLMQFRGRTTGNVERGVNVYCAANSAAARKQCLAMADCSALLFLPVGYGYSNGGNVTQQCYAMNDISYYVNINRITYVNISNGLPAGAIIKIYGVRV